MRPLRFPATRPALLGGVLALASASLFGVSTPLVQLAGAGIGPWTTAALLYAGAAMVGALTRRSAASEARVQPGDLRTLLVMALFGAAIGPAALAWGLQHTDGAGASLLLPLEAVFTALLARAVFGEAMDRHVLGAMLLLTGGSMVLVFQGDSQGRAHALGLLAVMAATLAWGIDNTLSRAVAERDPGQVVMCKAGLGVAVTTVAALASVEPWPATCRALALVAVGAGGYGFSLRLYLLAQRSFGAGRTASVFAFAPFIGALVAILLGHQALTPELLLAAGLMVGGVIMHLGEDHGHSHVHARLRHEHAHSHDDGHHMHTHDPMPRGSHSHAHEHEPIEHRHPHVPDAHHVHRH